MSNIQLRDYQQQAITDVRKAFHFAKAILLQLATASGKTIIAAFIIKQALAKGNTVHFGCHRKELINQTYESFTKLGIPCGIISSGYKEDLDKPVQIFSAQTMKSRLGKYPLPSLLIPDEAHLWVAKTFLSIINHYDKVPRILLTATPRRLSGEPLNIIADKMVQGPSMKELIRLGHLSKYRYFDPGKVDFSSVPIVMGDYKKSDSEKLINKPTITGSAINEFKKYCPGGQAIVFCMTVQHSKDVAESFRAAGISAEHLDGDTPKKKRAEIVARFKAGLIKVLTNVNLFSEGFDAPAIDAVILLRKTLSTALFLQMCGRALRTAPGKSIAYVFDHVGNYEHHGLPDDDREWSLDGHTKNPKKSDLMPLKNCPICFGVQKSHNKFCEFCNHEFIYDPQKIEEIDGELVEIDQEKLKKEKKIELKKEQDSCSTLQELEDLGRSRGYKKPGAWAEYLFYGRSRAHIKHKYGRK